MDTRGSIKTMKQKEFYSIPEVAEIMGVSITTVRRFIKDGKIESIQRIKRGKHIIPRLAIPTLIRLQKEAK